MGSSPRVRGTVLMFRRCVCPVTGIIPACAGNSYKADKTYSGHKDHPRVCGEQSQPKKGERNEKGSSPRVRGTGNICEGKATDSGIIPACAGNRRVTRHGVEIQRDHPRVCGEQFDPIKDPVYS